MAAFCSADAGKMEICYNENKMQGRRTVCTIYSIQLMRRPFFTAWNAGGRMQAKEQQGAIGIYFV